MKRPPLRTLTWDPAPSPCLRPFLRPHATHSPLSLLSCADPSVALPLTFNPHSDHLVPRFVPPNQTSRRPNAFYTRHQPPPPPPKVRPDDGRAHSSPAPAPPPPLNLNPNHPSKNTLSLSLYLVTNGLVQPPQCLPACERHAMPCHATHDSQKFRRGFALHCLACPCLQCLNLNPC